MIFLVVYILFVVVIIWLWQQMRACGGFSLKERDEYFLTFLSPFFMAFFLIQGLIKRLKK